MNLINFEVKNLCNFKLKLLPDVFVPNDATKLFIRTLPLVESEKNQRVLDLGTGTGIFSLYLASKGYSDILAVDNDDFSLKCAQINVKDNGFSDVIEVRKSDVFSGIRNNEKFALILTNPQGVIIGNNRRNRVMVELLQNIGNVMVNGRVVFLQPTFTDINYIKQQFMNNGFRVNVLAREAFKLNLNQSNSKHDKLLIKKLMELNSNDSLNKHIENIHDHPAMTFEMVEVTR